MKIVTSILLMYLGVLMAQPFANMELSPPNKVDNCHPGKCCKEARQQQSEAPVKNQRNSCNRDFCNPFVPCGTSIACCIPLHYFVNQVSELSKQLKPVINENITSSYLSDCWRPPELS
jgi:hypothetical protein